MSKSTLDFSHPYFQKQLEKYKSDPDFEQGLNDVKAKIEAEHTSCHRVVQNGLGKYPDLQNKIWKYDWAPQGIRSAHRKAWRMIVIVPEPFEKPYRIIAAAIYPKNSTEQLTAKQLAGIFAAITSPEQLDPPSEEEKYKIADGGNGNSVLICTICFNHIGRSQNEEELLEAWKAHECPGPSF